MAQTYADGELFDFLSYVTLLLDNIQTRRMSYLIIASIWLLPLSTQTLFYAMSNTSSLSYDSFCVTRFTCLLAFNGVSLIAFSLILQFLINYI